MRTKSSLTKFNIWLYEFEIERGAKIISSGQIVIGTQTAVAILLGIIFINHINVIFSCVGLLYLSAILSFTVSGVYSLLVIWGQKYEYMGNPDTLNKQYLSNIEWIVYEKKYMENVNRTHQDAILDDLIDRLGKCNSRNYRANNRRSKNRHISVLYLIISIVLTSVSFFVFGLIDHFGQTS